MKKTVFLFLIVQLFLAGCTSQHQEPYRYQIPEKLEDGLEVGSLESVKIDKIFRSLKASTGSEKGVSEKYTPSYYTKTALW